jgi:hypothetical protein
LLLMLRGAALPRYSQDIKPASLLEAARRRFRERPGAAACAAPGIAISHSLLLAARSRALGRTERNSRAHRLLLDSGGGAPEFLGDLTGRCS